MRKFLSTIIIGTALSTLVASSGCCPLIPDDILRGLSGAQISGQYEQVARQNNPNSKPEATYLNR